MEIIHHVSYHEAMITSDAQDAHDQLITLGQVTVKFSAVHRATLYPDGHYENDTEHSFHLALSATELAANYHPELDVGLVSQFCIVHDFPEIYAGDVPSFNMDNATKQAKEEAEQAATTQLLAELPPHTAQLLRRYENQEEPEARFVRFIDKLLPAVIHTVATSANRDNFFDKYNITSVEDVIKANEAHHIKMQAMFPEFDFILAVRRIIMQTSQDRLFSDSK